MIQIPAAPISPALWVARLETAVDAVERDLDREAAHDARVACRRLVVWLDLAGQRVLRDDLVALRDRISELRDLDVLRSRSLPSELRAWVRAQRAAARARLCGLAAEAHTSALIRALSYLPPSSPDAAQARLGRLAARAMRASVVLLEAEPAPEALHVFRRRLRPVRYGVEWLERQTPALRALTDALGDANDATQGQAALARWGGDALELKAGLGDAYAGALARARMAWPHAQVALFQIAWASGR